MNGTGEGSTLEDHGLQAVAVLHVLGQHVARGLTVQRSPRAPLQAFARLREPPEDDTVGELPLPVLRTNEIAEAAEGVDDDALATVPLDPHQRLQHL